MTQGDLFQEVIERIKPTESEREIARDHRDEVLEVLKDQNLGIIGVRSYGSYAKYTGISPLDDLDVIVYISPDKYPKKDNKRVLHTISRSIRTSFPYEEVITGTRSVKVKYDSGFIIDIVPAFTLDKKNLEPAEILDRDTGRWIETSPSKHIRFVNLVKKKDRRFKDLVRLFKVWKYNRRRIFRSFLIELLISDAIFNNAVPRGWAEAVYSIFNYVNNHKLKKKIYFDIWHSKPSSFPREPVVVLDPVNPKNNVANDFTESSRIEFMNSWTQDTRNAYKALNSNDQSDIIEYWQKVFGDVVPYWY